MLTMTRLIVATLATAAALAPSPVKPAVVARRDVANVAATFAAAVALPAFADDAPAAAPPAEDEAPAPVEFPKDWGITSDYYTDAAKVVAHMRLATSLEKGAPNMEMIALNCKKEMIDFVARGARIKCRGTPPPRHGPDRHAIFTIPARRSTRLTGRFPHRCRSTAASRT